MRLPIGQKLIVSCINKLTVLSLHKKLSFVMKLQFVTYILIVL